MGTALSYSTKSSYAAFNGASSTSFTGLPTGVPVIMVVVNGYGSTATLSGFQLATDALSPVYTTSKVVATSGNEVYFLYFDSITTANQNLTLTNSGSYAEGLAYAFTVSGHDSSAPFFATTADSSPTTLNFSVNATGNSILGQFFGSTDPNATFGEGTWSHGTPDVGVTFWSSDLSAGTKAISMTGVVYTSAALVEIKAAGGSSSILLPQMKIPPFFGFTPGFIR